jgi:hypothetical protein
MLLSLVFVFGCASTPPVALEPECDRKVFNGHKDEIEPFVCLGETLEWGDMTFRLLAEAVEPTNEALIAFFDHTGDCVIDAVGIYFLYEGAYYFGDVVREQDAYQIIAESEEELGYKILKEVDCLKK